MYAYEGLGSIYWHMVSKLLLAVSENVFRASEEGASRQVIDELTRHYRQIQQGIGAEKNPSEYGAFPTDPYSHTPENSGVKQPGMTGQVKEDVLSRLAELGLHVENGCLKFRTGLFDENELLAEPDEFPVVDGRGNLRQIPLPAGSLGFTICQVPVVMTRGTNRRIRIIYSDGLVRELHGLSLDRSSSRDVIDRSGKIIQLECEFS